MTPQRAALGTLVASGWFVFACTSAEVEPDPPATTPDVFVPQIDASDARDANRVETSTADAGPPSRLEVTCDKEPCYVAVSGNGGKHFCGLLKDGTVRCWGRDTMSVEPAPEGGVASGDGALGRGSVATALEGATPAPVVGLGDVTQISVGPNLGTCARKSDGSVYCWGRNEFGQLGQKPAQASLPLPTKIEGLPPVDAVALGWRTGCAIATADHALYCWGLREGVIGLGTNPGDGAGEQPIAFPPQLMPRFAAPVRQIAIGSSLEADTIVALLDQGVLATLGSQPAGESSKPPSSPNPITVTGVVRSGSFAYVDDDGHAQRWVPKRGELYLPSPATAVEITISSADGQGGALLSSGRLYRWGPNAAGTLGVPPDTLPSVDHPVEMKQVAGDRVVSFATTGGSTCASRTDGTVTCWGSNLRGELGRGTVDATAHPESQVIR